VSIPNHTVVRPSIPVQCSSSDSSYTGLNHCNKQFHFQTISLKIGKDSVETIKTSSVCHTLPICVPLHAQITAIQLWCAYCDYLMYGSKPMWRTLTSLLFRRKCANTELTMSSYLTTTETGFIWRSTWRPPHQQVRHLYLFSTSRPMNSLSLTKTNSFHCRRQHAHIVPSSLTIDLWCLSCRSLSVPGLVARVVLTTQGTASHPEHNDRLWLFSAKNSTVH